VTDITISAKDVKALRDRTGAGMMDCKRALTEAGGDVDKAIEILRVKQGKRIEDRGERQATEGTVQTYVHSNAKVGVLVEVDCETDFVARNDDFVAFAREVALHIAAAAPEYVTEEDVDDARRQAELRIYEQEAADKPENVRARIAEGKLRKWYESVVLLSQPHVNGDRYDGKTIGQLLDETRAKTGENVIIRRFARFAVGQ
jgi:elongation factor Ts